MREILFRGKTLDGNVWVLGYYERGFTGLIADSHYIAAKTDYKVFRVDPETVGQYTGFIDKNGVKIFEGDIVRYTNKELSENFVGVVKFGEYVHYKNFIYQDKHYGFFIDWANRPVITLRRDIIYWVAFGIEVVGNIHDNPELLSS